MQSLINTHEVLLLEARDLVNEVTRIRLELEEEKLKNFRKNFKLRLSHTSITKTKNQTSSKSSNNKNGRPDLKPALSLDQQLKDYRSKHNRQRLT